MLKGRSLRPSYFSETGAAILNAFPNLASDVEAIFDVFLNLASDVVTSLAGISCLTKREKGIKINGKNFL